MVIFGIMKAMKIKPTNRRGTPQLSPSVSTFSPLHLFCVIIIIMNNGQKGNKFLEKKTSKIPPRMVWQS